MRWRRRRLRAQRRAAAKKRQFVTVEARGFRMTWSPPRTSPAVLPDGSTAVMMTMTLRLEKCRTCGHVWQKPAAHTPQECADRVVDRTLSE